MLNKLIKKITNIYKPKLKSKKKVYCSPSNKKNTFSCFTLKSLKKIANKWNSLNEKKIKITNSKTKLWNKIRSSINRNHEWCWIQEKFVKDLNDDEINNTFRPEIPEEWYKNKNEWLSTIDIEDVMKQYEKQYGDFEFIGPVPIDFDLQDTFGNCLIDELCKININKYKKNNINKIGIIFNLDKHDESGSHWVALFCDLLKKKIYYFDSYGIKPPKEVNILANKIIVQGKEDNMKIKYYINNNRFQFKGSECGIYCIYFITELLKGKTFNKITKKIINDDDMMKNRGLFYSPNCKI